MTFYRVVVQVHGAIQHHPSGSNQWELLAQFGAGGDNQPVQAPSLVEALDNIEHLIAVQWERLRENAPIVDMAPPPTPTGTPFRELSSDDHIVSLNFRPPAEVEVKDMPHLPAAGTLGMEATPDPDAHQAPRCLNCHQPIEFAPIDGVSVWYHPRTNEVRCDPRALWSAAMAAPSDPS